MTNLKKRGRKPGQALRVTCSECGGVEMGMYVGKFARCAACKLANSREVMLDSYRCSDGGSYAHAVIKRAVDEGAIPAPSNFKCSDCPAQASQYDHRDYNRPMDVEPVCASCNKRRGPAIPWPHHIEHRLSRGFSPYRQRAAAEKLLALVGLPSELVAGMPRTLDVAHWTLLAPHVVPRIRSFAKDPSHA